MARRVDADFEEFREIFADPERRAAYFAGSSMTIPDETARKLLADELRLRAMYDRLFASLPERPPTARELRLARWRRREKWVYLVAIPIVVIGGAIWVFLAGG